ncbi:MAG TPA: M56 family metallopeptidase [Candidatus Angelobacter sp.]|jgi:beta-lactamase regulating signal transducer with metallopeptidase domain
MNAWLNTLSGQLPAALNIAVQVTILLIAGLAVQRIARRSPAARYAVLLWTLIAAGLCPLIVAAMRLVVIPVPLVIRRSAQPFNILFGNPGVLPSLPSGGQFNTSHHSFFIEIVAVLWAAGVLVSLVGMVRGLIVMTRIRQSAQTAASEKIAGARPQLLNIFGHDLPRIFTSDHVAVPMAVGYLQPIVLVPSSLVARLSDQQLEQVLIHECAHVQRHDALVVLYQRIVRAVLWFHPLVYFASRLLDRTREEICDNYVLKIAPAREYSQTLLTVAESLPQKAKGWFAPALIQSANLENRVAGLLNLRRCIVTQLTAKKVAAIAVCFLGSVIALSCFAGAAGQSSNDFSHVVNLQNTSTGDNITIQEVRGPSDTLVVGNIYEVRGTYRLVSQDKAVLAVNVATEMRHPGEPSVPKESYPPLERRKIIVEKGEGSFTLQFYMVHGQAHVSFYPVGGGSSFASRNFGNAILYPGQ